MLPLPRHGFAQPLVGNGSCCLGYVERFDTPLLWQTKLEITPLTDETRDTRRLRSHHKRETATHRCVPNEVVSMLSGTPSPKALALEVIERLGEVGNLRNRKVHHGTRRGLIRPNPHRGRPRFGYHNARCAHDLRCAHDSAKIALVDHMVEHDHKRIALPGTSNDIGEGDVVVGADSQHDTLMGTVR